MNREMAVRTKPPGTYGAAVLRSITLVLVGTVVGATGGGVYAKQLSNWLARKVSEAVYFAGSAEKVIFGTDYPVTKYSDALALVNIMEVNIKDKERILWRNAESLFSL